MMKNSAYHWFNGYEQNSHLLYSTSERTFPVIDAEVFELIRLARAKRYSASPSLIQARAKVITE